MTKPKESPEHLLTMIALYEQEPVRIFQRNEIGIMQSVNFAMKASRNAATLKYKYNGCFCGEKRTSEHTEARREWNKAIALVVIPPSARANHEHLASSLLCTTNHYLHHRNPYTPNCTR